MNQLIVILIIIRNWIKPHSASLLKLTACIIGLLISFAIYDQYNSIESQQITICCNTSKSLDLFKGGGSLYVNLDYSQSEDKALWDSRDLLGDDIREISGNYVRYSGLRSPKDTITPLSKNEYLLSNDLLDALPALPDIADALPDSIVGYTYCSIFFTYNDNAWFMPRLTESIRNTLLNPQILYTDTVNQHITVNTICEIPEERIVNGPKDKTLSGWRVGRKHHYFYLESLNLFNFPDSGSVYNNSDIFFKQMLICPNRYYAPKFTSAYDVSKLNLKLVLEGDSLRDFTLGFRSPVEFSDTYPAPDKVHTSYIEYMDAAKIETIKENGLNIFVKFPECESLQESRNYILSAIITLFLTLTATIGWTLFRKAHKQKSRINKFFKRLGNSHAEYFIKFKNRVLFSNLIIAVIVLSIFFILNPYDWLWVEFLCVLIILSGLVVFMNALSTMLQTSTQIMICRYRWRLLSSGLSITFVGFGLLLLCQHICHIRDIIFDGGLFIFIATTVGCAIGLYISHRKLQKRL